MESKVVVELTKEEQNLFITGTAGLEQMWEEGSKERELFNSLWRKVVNAVPAQASALEPDWTRAPEWATCAVLFEFGGNKYSNPKGEWNFYEVEPTIDTNEYGVPRLNYVAGKWGPGQDPQRIEMTTPITVHRRPELAIDAALTATASHT